MKKPVEVLDYKPPKRREDRTLDWKVVIYAQVDKRIRAGRRHSENVDELR